MLDNGLTLNQISEILKKPFFSKKTIYKCSNCKLLYFHCGNCFSTNYLDANFRDFDFITCKICCSLNRIDDFIIYFVKCWFCCGIENNEFGD